MDSSNHTWGNYFREIIGSMLTGISWKVGIAVVLSAFARLLKLDIVGVVLVGMLILADFVTKIIDISVRGSDDISIRKSSRTIIKTIVYTIFIVIANSIDNYYSGIVPLNLFGETSFFIVIIIEFSSTLRNIFGEKKAKLFYSVGKAILSGKYMTAVEIIVNRAKETGDKKDDNSALF